MSRFSTLAAAALAWCAIAGQAGAETVTVRDDPSNGGSVFNSGLGRNVSITFNGTNRTVGAGAFGLQFGSGAGWTDFVTFCLDLNEWLLLPAEYHRVGADAYFGVAADRDAMGILYGNLMTAEHGLQDATSAAALQSIIWEIREDGAANFNLQSGAFRLLTNDVLLRAQSLWGLIASGGFQPVAFDIFSARGTQDLLVSEVPLPAGFVLFGSALAIAGAMRRPRAKA